MTGPVPKLWSGSTVVILAGGPSLRTQPLAPLFSSGPIEPRVKIVTVNDSWRLLQSFEFATSKPFVCRQCNGGNNPECAFCHGTNLVSSCAMYFCDHKWWDTQIARNHRTHDRVYSFHYAIYKGWWWSGSMGFSTHPQVNALRLGDQTGLSDDPSMLCHGSNSGYQAINLAVHLGAKKIVLLGYDMKVDLNRTHWHDEPRPDGFASVLAQSMLPHFKTLVGPLKKAGVKVINATPQSALDCFPRATLEEALRA